MPVDLKKDTLFTEALIQVENNRFFWYQRIHHIVMDGYGFSLLSQKVANEYTSLIEETNKNEKDIWFSCKSCARRYGVS